MLSYNAWYPTAILPIPVPLPTVNELTRISPLTSNAAKGLVVPIPTFAENVFLVNNVFP